MTTVVNKVNKPVIAGEKVVFVSEIKEVKMKEVKLNNTTLDLAKIMLQANSSYLEEKKYKTNENKVKDVKWQNMNNDRNIIIPVRAGRVSRNVDELVVFEEKIVVITVLDGSWDKIKKYSNHTLGGNIFL